MEHLRELHYKAGDLYNQTEPAILTNLCNENFTDAFKPRDKQLLSSGKNAAQKFYTALCTLSTQSYSNVRHVKKTT